MAAGLGTRLAPLTDSTAKPLAPVVDRPVMEHTLRLLARHGVGEVAVNLHHHAEAIRARFGDGAAFGLHLRYNVEEELLGTAGGVGHFRDFLAGGTFVVMSGDGLTDVDLSALVAAHRAAGGLATLAVKQVADPSLYGVVVHDDADRIVAFQEKPARAEALSDLCNCGIYVFEPGIFDYVPRDAFVDWAADVFPRLLNDDVPFHLWRLATYWNDIGSLPGYARGNVDALLGRVSLDVPGSDAREGVRIGDDTRVAAGAVVEPPVLIGARCRVQDDARLVGPLVIGDECSIEAGAALKDSVVWSGVKVGERVSIGGSIVGHDVQIGAGAIIEAGAVLGDGCVVEADALVPAAARLPPHTVVERSPRPQR